MHPLSLPWLELCIALPLSGAVLVSLCQRARTAGRWCLVFVTLSLLCAVLAWLGHTLHIEPVDWQSWLLGQQLLGLDILSAPLVPAVALVHWLTVLATARTKERWAPFGWLLFSQAVRLATFSVEQPWFLIGLLLLGLIPPWVELRQRGQPTRLYSLHMLLFTVLILTGQLAVSFADNTLRPIGLTLLLLAILLRCGTVPFHAWIPDLFERASFATSLLFFLPITGVYAALRLLLPHLLGGTGDAPAWILTTLASLSLMTALYATGLALVQKEARRFFAYLFLSHASLILVGIELHTALSLTGSLCLWFSVMLSLAGLGLVLRALESRFDRLSLLHHRGLYDEAPSLAVCFLLTGLATVGFPGTLGFLSAEILIDGVLDSNQWLGIGVLAVTALNSIAIVRVWFLLFCGTRHTSMVPLDITVQERFAILLLTVLILGGGLFPQPGVQSRYQAATKLQRPG